MNSMWRCLATLICLIAPGVSATFGQTPKEIFQVQTPRGPVAAQVGVQRADVAFPNDTQAAAIITVYEPASRLFWWTFTYVDSTFPTGGFQGLESIVSVCDWRSHLVRGLYLVVVYQ